VIRLDGPGVTIADVVAVARDRRKVEISDAARARMTSARDMTIRFDSELDNTSSCLYPHFIPRDKTLFPHKTGKTACTVTTLFHFTAIGIKNSIAKVHIW
jgi:hypothetical protein